MGLVKSNLPTQNEHSGDTFPKRARLIINSFHVISFHTRHQKHSQKKAVLTSSLTCLFVSRPALVKRPYVNAWDSTLRFSETRPPQMFARYHCILCAVWPGEPVFILGQPGESTHCLYAMYRYAAETNDILRFCSCGTKQVPRPIGSPTCACRLVASREPVLYGVLSVSLPLCQRAGAGYATEGEQIQI